MKVKHILIVVGIIFSLLGGYMFGTTITQAIHPCNVSVNADKDPSGC